MDRKGILLVISGFSGAGKGTVVRRLLEKYDNYVVSVSATTRAPRPGEAEGVDYFFRTKEEFERKIAEGGFIEHACYVGHYYGTPKAYVEQKLGEGFDVILEIEIQGALQVKERFPDTCLIFISPPEADTLKRRLVSRGTEDPGVVDERLSRAVSEAEGIGDYDYFVINDGLDACVEEIDAIVRGEHCRTGRNRQLIEKITDEMKIFA